MKKSHSNLRLNGRLAEQKKHSEKVFSGDLLHVFKDEAVLPDASTGRREWIQHPGACAVVPLFENGDCVLIQQFRYPAQQLFWEVAMSTISGKISVNVISLYWISVFFFRSATLVHSVLLWASVTIMLFSFIMYLLRYRNIMKGARFN